MEDKMSDILRRAKSVLIERGWYQGDYVNPVTGEVCIMGAVNIAESGEPHCENDEDDDTPLSEFLHAMAMRFWFRDIGSWNDAKGRTPEQVLEFIDYMIGIAERRESRQAVDAVGLSVDEPVADTAR